MGIKVSVTKLNLTQEFKTITGITQQSAMLVLMGLKEKWAQEASERLNTTASAYIEGLYATFHSNASGFSGEVGLKGTWPNMLEQGFPSYDMKDSFATSKNRKMGKKGQWYANVPFRHYTPAANPSAGNLMPNSIYKEARKLPQWGKMGNTASTQVTQSGYGHKSTIYSGMQKVPQSANKNSYMTWRTVSENSSPNSWIHPGFKGVDIMDDLSSHLEDTFMEVFQSKMSNQ